MCVMRPLCFPGKFSRPVCQSAEPSGRGASSSSVIAHVLVILLLVGLGQKGEFLLLVIVKGRLLLLEVVVIAKVEFLVSVMVVTIVKWL